MSRTTTRSRLATTSPLATASRLTTLLCLLVSLALPSALPRARAQLSRRPSRRRPVLISDSERFELRRLTEQGGRFDVYRGPAPHQKIVFDAVNDRSCRGTEVYVMDDDGKNVRCLTFSLPLRRGHIGNPVWFTDGRHLVVQVANSNSAFGPYNHPVWGFDNDLWLIDHDSERCELLYRPPLHGAVLNPVFSDDGTVLVFAERVPQRRFATSLDWQTPGGENPWLGWRLHLCDFDGSEKKSGRNRLSNHRTIRPLGRGFYHPDQITKESRSLVFSHSPTPRPQLHEIYRCDLLGRQPLNLSHWPKTYDGHGAYSPGEATLAFASSRVMPRYIAGWTRPSLLKTEAYLRVRSKVTALTVFNRYVHPRCRYHVSNLCWDREGRRLFLLAEFFHERRPQSPRSNIFVITFREPL